MQELYDAGYIAAESTKHCGNLQALPPNASTKLFVSNCPQGVSDSDLYDLFFAWRDQIVNVTWAFSEDDGSFLGYGWVEFSSIGAAVAAQQLNGSRLREHDVLISFSQPKRAMDEDPPCAHKEWSDWKRLRQKNGLQHFVCVQCGAKWKRATQSRKDTERQRHEPLKSQVSMCSATQSTGSQFSFLQQQIQAAIRNCSTSAMDGVPPFVDRSHHVAATPQTQYIIAATHMTSPGGQPVMQVASSYNSQSPLQQQIVYHVQPPPSQFQPLTALQPPIHILSQPGQPLIAQPSLFQPHPVSQPLVRPMSPPPQTLHPPQMPAASAAQPRLQPSHPTILPPSSQHRGLYAPPSFAQPPLSVFPFPPAPLQPAPLQPHMQHHILNHTPPHPQPSPHQPPKQPGLRNSAHTHAPLATPLQHKPKLGSTSTLAPIPLVKRLDVAESVNSPARSTFHLSAANDALALSPTQSTPSCAPTRPGPIVIDNASPQQADFFFTEQGSLLLPNLASFDLLSPSHSSVQNLSFTSDLPQQHAVSPRMLDPARFALRSGHPIALQPTATFTSSSMMGAPSGSLGPQQQRSPHSKGKANQTHPPHGAMRGSDPCSGDLMALPAPEGTAIVDTPIQAEVDRLRHLFETLLHKITEGFPEAQSDSSTHIIHKLAAQKEHFEWFNKLTEDANLMIRSLADVYMAVLPAESPLFGDLQALKYQVKSDKWFA